MHDLTTCRVGHDLTGEEKLDVTGTPRCGACAKDRKRNWRTGLPKSKAEAHARLTKGTAITYRRGIKDMNPEDEHGGYPTGWS